MGGAVDKNFEVVCCFCGDGLFAKEAMILNVQPNIESNEIQQLFAYKKHFIEKINKSIPLHPDFFED